ncbi:MAG: hypothetical protein ACYCYP_07935 [Leptospirales bacterium]
MSRFYLESDIPQREQAKGESELREQVASMVKHTGFDGKLDPRTANIEVVKALAGPIHREFQETASKRGQLVTEEFQDAQGRTCRRFHGDPRAGLEGFSERGRRVRLSEISHFDGKVFLKGREPAHIRRAMLLRANGLE